MKMNDYNEGAFKGMCANQAFDLALIITKHYGFGKSGIEDEDLVLRRYEKIFPKLLEVNKKLLIDEVKVEAKREDGLEEVGVAWMDKKMKGKLNCKDKETGEWSNINLKDIEKKGSDGIYENELGQKFIFKEIPKEERKNEKMPLYRIYKEMKQ